MPHSFAMQPLCAGPWDAVGGFGTRGCAMMGVVLCEVVYGIAVEGEGAGGVATVAGSEFCTGDRVDCAA